MSAGLPASVETAPAVLTWHVVQCASRAERLATKRLGQLGYAVLHLHRHELRNHHRRKVEVAAALLPGYALLGLEPWQGLWDANTCPGVIEVLHICGRPQVVPRAEISRWQAKVDRAEPVLDPNGDPCGLTGCLGREHPPAVRRRGSLLRAGVVVLVTEGPFAGYHGVVAQDRGKPRVRVHVVVFERQVTVEIPAGALAIV